MGKHRTALYQNLMTKLRNKEASSQSFVSSECKMNKKSDTLNPFLTVLPVPLGVGKNLLVPSMFQALCRAFLMHYLTESS